MSPNDARDSNESGSARAEPRQFFGHPPGLFPLFFTEMWERFSFYLMISLLALYLTKYLGYGEATASDVTTWYLSLVYFTPFLGGLIADRLIGYSRAILAGGLLMMAGHIVLALDHRDSALLGIRNPFLFAALGLLIAGNGLFKPNISTLVGNLYAKGDPRRDRGFTIFYMGINLGAFVAPIAANKLRTKSVAVLRDVAGLSLSDDAGWHIAFGSAGVGMLLSLLVFATFRSRFGKGRAGDDAVEHVTALGGAELVESETDVRTDRLVRFGQNFNMIAVALALAWLLGGPLIDARLGTHLAVSVVTFGLIWLAIEAATVLIFLAAGGTVGANAAKLKAVFVVIAIFWMAFHQNSVTLTFFAEGHTQPVSADATLMGTPPPNVVDRVVLWPVQQLTDAETYQSINPLLILAFSPLMVLLWSSLDRKGLQPSSTTKMAMGMVVAGLAYVVMFGAGRSGGDTGRVGPGWLIACYALLTVAELWVSPIGLSLTSKLAPSRYRGLWMGFWFMATAVGNKLVHVTGRLWNEYPPSQLFLILVISSFAAAAVLVVLLTLLRWLGPPSTPD